MSDKFWISVNTFLSIITIFLEAFVIYIIWDVFLSEIRILEFKHAFGIALLARYVLGKMKVRMEIDNYGIELDISALLYLAIAWIMSFIFY